MKIPANQLQPFAKTVITGDKVRDQIAEHLLHAGAGIFMDPQTASCDFQMVYNNNVFRVEIKDEHKQAHTGNVCIEIAQGKPERHSGIRTSEATVTVHSFGEHCLLYRNVHMFAWIRQNWCSLTVALYGDNFNKCCLVPISSIKSLRWAAYVRTVALSESLLWTY